MNGQSTEDVSGSDTFSLPPSWWIRAILHLSKCKPPREPEWQVWTLGDSDMSVSVPQLWQRHRCGRDVDNGGGCVRGQRVVWTALDFPLSFAVNLKLL